MSLSSPVSSTAPATLLPVLDILNNVIVVTNYLNAAQSATLPAFITSDSQYAQLVDDFTAWQETLWEQYYEYLIDGGILAEVEQIETLIGTGVDFPPAVYASVFSPSGGVVPDVINSCDQVASTIAQGAGYVASLLTIANSIKNADQQKIAALNSLIATLNTQFNQMEQQLTDKAIDNSKEAVVTYVEVGVAVASEKDPIMPLVKGVAQVGTEVVQELVLTSEIQTTLNELEAAWNELDEATINLAQVNLVINQLNEVVSDTSVAVTALNAIENDWQTIVAVTDDSSSTWESTGLPQLTEWAKRMSNVNFVFAPVQQVS